MTKKFVAFLAGITVFRLLYAIILPIAPQEAYYWDYSRHPALSYFDHPPMAAYMIKLTTLFGDSNFSIHLAAILFSILMSFAIYRLASLLFNEKTAFWSVVAVNLTFIYALGGLIITPDNPMILFWLLTMIACFRIAEGGGFRWWILLGIFLGAGLLGKYTMAFAALGALLFFLISKERLRYLAWPGPYASLIVAFIVFLPVLIWNYQHGWASFVFQSERRASEMTAFRPDFFFGFIATVVGIYGIVPVPLLGAGIRHSLKRAIREKERVHLLLVSFSLPLVLFLIPVAAGSWVKMNWTAPAFIGWFIAATAYYFRYAGEKKWVRLLGKTSIAFLAATFVLLHIVYLLPNVYLGREDYSVGWKGLSSRIESICADMPRPYFICGYEYKTASLLSFYLKGHPETVSNNIVGRPGLQYDYWADPDTLAGYNAIFVYDDRVPYRNPERLSGFFQRVSPEESLTVKKGGKILTEFHILKCYGYKGTKESR